MQKVEERLYFGSVAVYFQKHPGKSFGYVRENFKEHTNDKEDLCDRANQRLKPGSGFEDQQYSTLVLPAIPATDVEIVKKTPYEHLRKKVDGTCAMYPSILCTPLLKVKEGKGDIVGMASGIRSAILPCTEDGMTRYIRLKGCGNNDQGFPLQQITKFPGCVEIRGCTFEHTASRELYYFDYVNDLIGKHNICPSNLPLGWFEYELPESEGFPLVKRCCAFYETRAEKRLGDHLLYGLDQLLEFFDFDLGTLISLFPNDRVESGCIIPTWVHLISVENEQYSLATIYDKLSLSFQVPEKIPINVDPVFQSLWINCCNEVKAAESILKTSPKTSAKSVLGYLLWRLGREVGTIQKIFSDNQMSWGTYGDSLGEHCNAHPNNLAVIPEFLGKEQFLAPLDFDMAFKRDVFSQGTKKFDENMKMELASMRLELSAGGFNTGVRQRFENFSNKPKYEALQWALRDTIVAGFMSGLNGAEDPYPPVDELNKASHALIKLGLMMTEKDIT